ncbi:hypothetical protein [Kitasatospora sp. GP82]|uniref:hypothetical protein n=1 Tax=Kitasatospora sp. GP82 TaxID=3035089 RepID=UPI002475D581|nr:hypothetical protein [Kitasatospora sp. GP82]MDH6126047.1 hypothetical protein [Kitasatospora sp. GP82]
MSEGQQRTRSVAFKVPCPYCADGVRYRVRMGVRGAVMGSGTVPEPCQWCIGHGWLPMHGTAWRDRPRLG